MAAKSGLNVDTLSFSMDLSLNTDDTQVLLGTLDKDYMEVVGFTVAHRVSGVGAQNIVYTLRTTPTQTVTPFTSVSAATGNVANATVGVSGSAAGNGLNQTVLAEGRNLWLDVNFAAAVTGGPYVAVIVTLRK